MKKKLKKNDSTGIVRKGIRVIRTMNDKYTSAKQKGMNDSRLMSRGQKIHFSMRKKANGEEIIVVYGIDRRTFKRYVIGYVEVPIKGKY